MHTNARRSLILPPRLRSEHGLEAGRRVTWLELFFDLVFVFAVSPLSHHLLAHLSWRGAGETLSCGTGACAAVVAGIARGLLDSPVRVETRGGALTISWAGGDNPVWMKGPAETVYEGSLDV